MTRLEELREQKRLIEAEIRAIKDAAICCGCVKLDKETCCVEAKQWRLSVKKSDPYYDSSRWMTIVYGGTKEECLAKVPIIIDDLKGLLQMLRKETGDEKAL